MSISTELQRIKTNISDSYTAAANKGATIPANQSGDNLATTISSIVSAGVNPQNRTAYESGTYTYENNSIVYNCFVMNSPINSYGRVYVKSPVSVGSIVYNSRYDSQSNLYLPDLNSPISSVYAYDYQNEIQVNIGMVTYMAPERLDWSVTISNNYDSLNSVEVNIEDSLMLGVIKTNINSSLPSICHNAFLGNKRIETLVTSASFLGTRCFADCENLTSVTLTNYEGYTLRQDGSLDTDFGGESAFRWSSIDYFSAPQLKILPSEFMLGENSLTTLNLPNLIGMASFNSIGNIYNSAGSGNTPYEVLKAHNINIEDFECMGSYFGPILEQYVSDPDNNITDTLTFSNLKNIGSNFTNFQGAISRNNLDNITSFIVPNLKYTHPNCLLDLPITSIDLPEIVQLDSRVFSTNTLTTINIGSKITNILYDAFNSLDGVTINIDLPEPQSPTGDWRDNAPWGATNATVNWIGTNS